MGFDHFMLFRNKKGLAFSQPEYKELVGSCDDGGTIDINISKIDPSSYDFWLWVAGDEEFGYSPMLKAALTYSNATMMSISAPGGSAKYKDIAKITFTGTTGKVSVYVLDINSSMESVLAEVNFNITK